MELTHERGALIPAKPGQFANLGWAALCALGGISYGWAQHVIAPRAATLIGGTLVGVAVALVAINLVNYFRLEREGWWMPIEAEPLGGGRTLEGKGWVVDVQDDHIHTIHHGRYGPVENMVRLDAIKRVDVLGDGTSLVLTNEFVNPYMSIEWDFLPKAQRIALLRWVREHTQNALFTPFAEEVESGWFPRAVR